MFNPPIVFIVFFPQFNKGITRARKCRVAKPREARAAAREEKRENLFFRAFSHSCGHFRVSSVSLDGLRASSLFSSSSYMFLDKKPC